MTWYEPSYRIHIFFMSRLVYRFCVYASASLFFVIFIYYFLKALRSFPNEEEYRVSLDVENEDSYTINDNVKLALPQMFVFYNFEI